MSEIRRAVQLCIGVLKEIYCKFSINVPQRVKNGYPKTMPLGGDPGAWTLNILCEEERSRQRFLLIISRRPGLVSGGNDFGLRPPPQHLLIFIFK